MKRTVLTFVSMIVLFVLLSIKLFRALPRVFASTEWTKISSLQEQNIASLAVNGQTLFAGAGNAAHGSGGGLYRSTDKGNTWEKVGLEGSNIREIAIGQSAIFAGTDSTGVHPYGMYRSLDNGTSWEHTGPEFNVTSLEVTDTAIFTGTNNGLYRSVDNGNNWVQTGLSGQTIQDISASGDVLLVTAGTYYPSFGIYRSDDRGNSWDFVRGSGSYTTVGLFGKTGLIAFQCCFNPFSLMRSSDAGLTWGQVSAWSTVAGKPGPFTNLGPDLYAGGYRNDNGLSQAGVYRSSDEGVTWTDVSNGFAFESDTTLSVRALVSSEETKTVYAAINSRGIWKMTPPEPVPVHEPVILIPGGGGSELFTTDNANLSVDNGHGGTWERQYKNDEKIWVNQGEALRSLDDDYFDVLKLNPDGITPVINGIQAKSLVYTIVPDYFEAYTKWRPFWESQRYTYGKDIFEFPYDFRYDVRTTVGDLDATIHKALIAANNGETDENKWEIKQVNFVTHSLGGLVARAYLSSPVRARYVHRLIAIAPAFLGTTKYLKAVLYGDDFGSYGILNPNELKDIIQNSPGGFEVIPGKVYTEFYNGSGKDYPVPFREDRDFDNDGQILGDLRYEQMKKLLSNAGTNMQVFGISESFHDSIDTSWKNGLPVPEVDIIAGSGVCTPGQLRVYNSLQYSLADKKLRFIPKAEFLHISGDGTVPLFSATMEDAARGIDYNDNTNVYFTNQQEHFHLPTDNNVMQFAANLLNGNHALSVGITDTQAGKCNGQIISVESPVELHIYSENGSHTGLKQIDIEGTQTQIAEEGIPGSTYEELDEAKYIFLPDDGVYTIKLKATDEGSFTLRLRSYINDREDRIVSYLNVPLTKATTGSMTFNTSTNDPPLLLIDSDGNGSTDETLDATSDINGEQLSDSQPPWTVITEPQDGTGVVGDVTVSWETRDDVTGVLNDTGVIDYDTSDEKTVEKGQTLSLSPDTHSLTVFTQDNIGNSSKTESRFIIHPAIWLPPFANTHEFKSLIPVTFRITNPDGSAVKDDTATILLINAAGKIATGPFTVASNPTGGIIIHNNGVYRFNLQVKDLRSGEYILLVTFHSPQLTGSLTKGIVIR